MQERMISEMELFAEWNQFPDELEEVQRLQDLKQYEQALTILRRILQINPNHFMATTMADRIRGTLGDTLCRKGKYKEALALYGEIQDGTDGDPDQPKLLALKNNIALTLLEQGKYKESEAMFKEVTEKLIEALGPDHPEALVSQSNFARVLDRLGKYKESLSLYRKILDKQRELSGVDDLKTLITQNNMAMVLLKTGKYEEALRLFKHVFKVYKDTLGPDDPETLSVQNNVGKALQHLDNYEDALTVFEHVYQVRKEKLGANHPRTLTTQHQMAQVLNLQGRLPEAKKAFNEAQIGHRKVLGPDHPEAKNANQGMGKMRQRAKNNEKYHPEFIKMASNMNRLYNLLNSDLSPHQREALKKLLADDVDISFGLKDGKTPLHIATIKNDNDIVLSLIRCAKRKYPTNDVFHIINAKTSSAGNSPLHIAAMNGCLETMKSLLRNGAMWQDFNSENQSPLHLCKNESTKALLTKIEDFFEAVEKNNVEKVKKLRTLKDCELSAVTNTRNSREFTLLQVSSSLKLREISMELIKIIKERPFNAASTSEK